MVQAWRALAPEQRLAALAAIGLLVTMLLPWYVETDVLTKAGRVSHTDLTAFGAFTFVEAAVLLIAASVLLLLFARAERKAFHLPGGDGPVITLAGVWAAVLIFYRMLDTPSTAHTGSVLVTEVGLKWGIFFTMAAAVVLAVAGLRVRAAHRPEPPLPAGGPPDPGRVPLRSRAAATARAGERTRRGTEITRPLPPAGPPTAVTTPMPRQAAGAADEAPTTAEPGVSPEQLSLDVDPPDRPGEEDRA